MKVMLEPVIHNSTHIADNYQHVMERIHKAARSAGRDPASIRLVVVTKAQPLDIIRTVIEAGAHFLGENYAEEAISKKQVLKNYPGIGWHMIGHVQSRKAELVVTYFNYLHSLDSLKLANRLNRCTNIFGCIFQLLLEFNVSGESSKYGWPAWQEETWEKLLPEIRQVLDLPNIKVHGLMTMAPFFPDPEQTRPYFQRLCRLQQFLIRRLPQSDWSELSMGMSADFEVAVQEGATWVRIGQAILGPRQTK